MTRLNPAIELPGVGADRATEGVADVDQPAELGQPPGDLSPGQAVQATLEAQQLDPGLLGIEGRLLQGDADAEPDDGCDLRPPKPAIH